MPGYNLPLHNVCHATLIMLFLASPIKDSVAQDAPEQASKPGLVATYSDGQNQVVLVVPTPDFSLDPNESIHPQIDREFTAQWTGVLRIDRAGRYRLSGQQGADIRINNAPATDWVQLATGEHPIEIRHKKKSVGAARLALQWESDYFGWEPVPSLALRHVEEPDELAKQESIEHGRYLFAELGCGNCHAAENWDLQTRRGPDLSHVATRTNSGWIYDWLRNPQHYRKAAIMPACLENDRDRTDVTAFLMTLKSNQELTNGNATPKQIETGRELFEQVGCVKCHDKENNLDAVGSKYSNVTSLADFIANPHAVDPDGRMPQLFDGVNERHLALSIASYLFAEKVRTEPYAQPPQGDSKRGARLFASNGCASCHAATSTMIAQEDVLRGPAIGQSAGLELRNFWNFGDNKPIVKDVLKRTIEKVVGRTEFSTSDDARGAAFDFDGKTHIELTHFHRPDTMTISVWVKTEHGGSILTWGRPGGGQRGSRELRMNIGQDGKNSLCYGEYNSDGGWKPVIVRPNDVNLIDGKWHHIAVVRNGPAIQHYIDGRPQGKPGKAQAGGGDYTDRLLIGALGLQQNPSNYFKGLLDDLSIWSIALSPEQIASITNGVSPIEMARPPKRDIAPFDVQAGCLDENVSSPLPKYNLADADRDGLRLFLETVQPVSTLENESPEVTYQTAPLTTHNLRIRQFRCTACHQFHDENIQTAIQESDDGRIIRVERPPLLTGAGEKLTQDWLRDVLLEKKRNRPWLNLRMPHFGEGVSDLPELLAGACGVADDTIRAPDRKLAEAGLKIIGEQRGEVSCISCHDYRGINRRKDGVVPAPDLAAAGKTVRHEWFQRWMHNPSRLQPGTSMPQLFLDVPAEERELRIDQIWSALIYQGVLPLPKGVLDTRTEGTRIVVKDTPVLFRMATSTPVGQVDRAINVGIPGGFNFTFDPVECRLRYAWKGPFIDAGPAWNGRGGNPVKAGSPQIAAFATQHFVRIGDATDPKPLRFLGYRLEDRMPVFRYTVDGTIVEHRVDISDSGIFQRFVVRKPTQDVFYTGDEKTRFSSVTGERDGNVIRYAKAETVEFVIKTPTAK
jgi:mono/diheme cytochrome c family protein